MAWYGDQYLPDKSRRGESLVSPLHASTDELAGLPPALVINGQADVLRDEGEAYAAKLRSAGVPVTAPLRRHHPRLRDAAPACRDQRGPRRHRTGRCLPAHGIAPRLTGQQLR